MEDTDGHGVQEHGTESQHRRAKHLSLLSRTLMGQLAYACNRRSNAMQHRNGFFALACGASERLTTFLQDCALTTSHASTVTAAIGLTDDNLEQLKEIGSYASFHVTLDNVDINRHVSEEHVGHYSELLNGTFGYVHVQDRDIHGAYDLQAYAAHEAALPPVDSIHFVPSQETSWSFVTGIPAKFYRALARLAPHLGITLQDPRCTPEPLMDESDTSVLDVAEVVDRLRTQLGMTDEEFAERLRIIECDGGTTMLLESLRRNRSPFRRPYDGLGSLMTVPGTAHLQWCIGQAVLRRYFGDPSLGSNYQGSLFIVANLLGRKGINPRKVKDFNKMERLLWDAAQLELMDCLLLELKVQKLDDLRPTHLIGLDTAIQNIIRRYFHTDSLNRARENKEVAPVFYESLLRLRDLVDFEEGYFATTRGDIGRVIHWWERMAPFLQAVEGVSHYRTHLPHLLLLLKSDLPAQLSQIVQEGLLVSPSGRQGNFCWKDYFLETLNYWLKYFFSVKGAGVSFTRMRDVISSNVLLFRDLMIDMKKITGRTSYHRNHISNIDTRSVEMALANMRANKIHVLGDNTSNIWNLKTRPIVDNRREGIEKFMSMPQAAFDRLRYGPTVKGRFSYIETEWTPEQAEQLGHFLDHLAIE